MKHGDAADVPSWTAPMGEGQKRDAGDDELWGSE